MVPGLILDHLGFQADHPNADRFAFARQTSQWQPIEMDWMHQVVSLGNYVSMPSKAKLSLLSHGFALYFPKGFEFRLASTGAPYLTWAQGSVAEGVPTPAVSWAIVSFRTPQPPVLLKFQGTKPMVVTTGTAGNWVIRSNAEFSGWVHVGLPKGSSPSAPTSATGLAELVTGASEVLPHMTEPPRLIGMKLDQLTDALEATWTFDKPGALLPMAAQFAKLGGYDISTLSPTKRIAIEVDSAPLTVLTTNELKVRFPVNTLPFGRFLTLGDPKLRPAGIYDRDEPRAVELALTGMSGAATGNHYIEIEGALRGFLHRYRDSGDLDSRSTIADTASYAFLSQTMAASTLLDPPTNDLLSDLLKRIDWFSWSLLHRSADGEDARSASALLAIACAYCADPMKRFGGALLQAGLSAERGLSIRRQMGERNAAPSPKLLEVMEPLRAAIYRLPGFANRDPWAIALLSKTRTLSAVPLTLEERDGKFFLKWESREGEEGAITLTGPYQLQLGRTSNLAQASIKEEAGVQFVRFKPLAAGACEVELVWTAPFEPPPRLEEPPVYVEYRR